MISQKLKAAIKLSPVPAYKIAQEAGFCSAITNTDFGKTSICNSWKAGETKEGLH